MKGAIILRGLAGRRERERETRPKRKRRIIKSEVREDGRRKETNIEPKKREKKTYIIKTKVRKRVTTL